MNRNDLYNSIGEIDDALLERSENNTAAKKRPWIKWAALAACFAAIACVGVLWFNTKDNPAAPGTDSASDTEEGNYVLYEYEGGLTREYKNAVEIENSAIIWPWEYKTVAEQYTTAVVNGVEYHTRGEWAEIDKALLGNELGDCQAKGEDDYTDKVYTLDTSAHKINGVDSRRMMAVELDGKYYVFIQAQYTPIDSLGAMLNTYSLPQTLKLSRYTAYDKSTENGSFYIESDDYIWQILSECSDATLVQDENWTPLQTKHLTFTATSKTLGVYKRVFYISDNGYLTTNIFDFRYVFDIGTEAAGKIMAYAAENGKTTEAEPYTYSIYGVITEIGDDYILIDDTTLCADPKDGMVFTVPTNDIRISRCIDFEKRAVGDSVKLAFNGSIDTNAKNLVNGAYAMIKVTINEDGVYETE